MGRVVNKSFERVRKDIAKKSEKLLSFLQDNNGNLYGDWTTKQSKMYDKLNALLLDLSEEIFNLDEIEVPEFEKRKD